MKKLNVMCIEAILNAINTVEKFTYGLGERDFLLDEKEQSAVAYGLVNIAKAAKSLPRPMKLKYKEIPWKEMAVTGDRMIRFYYEVDYEIV